MYTYSKKLAIIMISYHPPKHGAHDTNEHAKEGFKIAETCVCVCMCVSGGKGVLNTSYNMHVHFQ